MKLPKGSKRFSSGLTRDVVIAFRMTAKADYNTKLDQKLGLFPYLISASL